MSIVSSTNEVGTTIRLYVREAMMLPVRNSRSGEKYNPLQSDESVIPSSRIEMVGNSCGSRGIVLVEYL